MCSGYYNHDTHRPWLDTLRRPTDFMCGFAAAPLASDQSAGTLLKGLAVLRSTSEVLALRLARYCMAAAARPATAAAAWPPPAPTPFCFAVTASPPRCASYGPAAALAGGELPAGSAAASVERLDLGAPLVAGGAEALDEKLA